jgi:GTPase Era involved in 16S rRNA processing
MPLIIYPNRDNTELSFREAYKVTYAIKRDMKLVASIVKKPATLINSIHRIAKNHHAEFLVIGVHETNTTGKKDFSQAAWNLAADTAINVFLVQEGAIFDPSDVTIAVDFSKNRQKVTVLPLIADKEKTRIHLFVENTDIPSKQKEIGIVLAQVQEYLFNHDLTCLPPVIAATTTFYPDHLIRFVAKRTKILVLEIDEETGLNSELETSLKKILFGKHRLFSVLLVKTKPVGIPTGFN